MSAAIAPVRQGTDEWLAWRRNGIGSSDAPVIAGERDGYVELWAIKAGLVPEPPVDDASRRLMDIGKLMEPTLLALYERETGRRPERVYAPVVHRWIPYLFASLDARTKGRDGRRVVEAKWTHSGRWYDLGADPVPGDVYAQVQHQLAVTGYDVADVAVLRGRDFLVVEVPRDEAYIADLVAEEGRFWRYVETRERPPLDGSETTRRVLSALHPRNDEAGLLPATPDVVVLADQYREAKARAKAVDAEADTIANALRAVIGDADGYALPWGAVSWRKNADSTRTNWPAVAKAYRVWLEEVVARSELDADDRRAALDELDAIESIHSETVQGARVLRLSEKGNRS